MERWLDPDQETARKRLLGLLFSLLAKRQVVFDRFSHCFSQFRDRLSFEGDHIAEIDDLAMEDITILIEFNFGYITLIFHHGLSPASDKNRRTERTMALLASFAGWGR
jgi:hypothetical protein